MKLPEKFKLLLFIAIPVFLLDQVSKQLVFHSVTQGDSVSHIKGILNLTHVQNTGAAFSLFSTLPAIFFLLISFVAIGIIFYFFAQVQAKQKLLATGLSLILGGALGNICDRIIFSFVIDFIDIYIFDWHWPSFNVADIAITLGVLMLIADMFLSQATETTENS